MRSLSWRHVRAIIRKELRTYRRSRSIIVGMAILPAIFLLQPLVVAFLTPTDAVATLRHHHELLYLLAIPAFVPVTMAAYSIVGERQWGTLEPILAAPIQRDELVMGKALAVLIPSVGIAYLVFCGFLVLVVLFAHAGVASALIRGPEVIAQLIFTPLIAGYAIWCGLAISTRVGEVRAAQQLAVLASVPAVVVTTLVTRNVIHVSTGVVVGLGAALLVVNGIGWWVVSVLFDRERLITGTR